MISKHHKFVIIDIILCTIGINKFYFIKVFYNNIQFNSTSFILKQFLNIYLLGL